MERLKTSRTLFLALALIGASAGFVAASAATVDEDPELVFLTLDEGLAKVFAGADTVWAEAWTPAADEKQAVERRLGWRLEQNTFTFYRARKDGKSLGWAMVTEQVGHHRLITFLIHVTPDQRVGAVEVMVYRESRGGEIRRQRFLRQYRDKDLDDHIRLNRDIVGITGATLSVRATNASVRRVLTLVDARYGHSKGVE